MINAQQEITTSRIATSPTPASPPPTHTRAFKFFGQQILIKKHKLHCCGSWHRFCTESCVTDSQCLLLLSLWFTCNTHTHTQLIYVYFGQLFSAEICSAWGGRNSIWYPHEMCIELVIEHELICSSCKYCWRCMLLTLPLHSCKATLKWGSHLRGVYTARSR